MPNLQNPARRKLKTIILLILFFWQANHPQKIEREIPLMLLKTCWMYPTTKTADINLASDNVNNIYISLVGGTLVSIDSVTGKKIWETALGGDIIASPVISDNNIYIAAKYQNAPIENGLSENGLKDSNILKIENKSEATLLRALDKSTGVTRWQSALAPSDKIYLFAFEDYLIAVGDNGEMNSVGKSDGKIAWSVELGTKLSSSPLIKNTEIFLGTSDRRILKLSLTDGRVLEQTKIPAPPTVIIENSGKNKLIVGDGKGNLLSLNKRFGKNTKAIEWKFRNGAEISSVTLTAKGLLITSFDNFIYMVSETGGKLIWKKRFSGRVIAAPLVKDNFFIVSSADEAAASVIELNSGRSVNKITLENDNFFTGLPLKTGNLLVYSTLRGVFGYAFDEADCRLSKKPEEQSGGI
jgi:outer membrane protein assembly factor BamB